MHGHIVDVAAGQHQRPEDDLRAGLGGQVNGRLLHGVLDAGANVDLVVQQKEHRVVVGALQGEVQVVAAATVRLLAHVQVTAGQCLGAAARLELHRQGEGRVAVVVGAVEVGGRVLDQQLHDGRRLVEDGNVQGRLPLAVGHVRVHGVLQQRLHHLRHAPGAGHVQLQEGD